MPHSPCIELDAAERKILLDAARESIRSGLAGGLPSLPETATLSAQLRAPSAVFVTLKMNGDLRGCIGSLAAREPLLEAVATAAFNAAFRDRRFTPLRAREFESLGIEVSVLSKMEPLHVESRRDLLHSLRPGIDGLMVEDGASRATFLPQVWGKIGDAGAFVDELFAKAGLGPGHWSDSLRFHRYRTFSFGE